MRSVIYKSIYNKNGTPTGGGAIINLLKCTKLELTRDGKTIKFNFGNDYHEIVWDDKETARRRFDHFYEILYDCHDGLLKEKSNSQKKNSEMKNNEKKNSEMKFNYDEERN